MSLIAPPPALLGSRNRMTLGAPPMVGTSLAADRIEIFLSSVNSRDTGSRLGTPARRHDREKKS
jgi:hypothetical protein